MLQTTVDVTMVTSLQRRCEEGIARSALERYGMEAVRLGFIKGRGNRLLFRADSPAGGAFVVRLYGLPESDQRTHPRSEEWLRSRVRSQLLWQAALRRAGLCVPEPVLALDGSLVPRAGSEKASWLCTVLRWAPGRHKGAQELEQEDFLRVGSYVGRMHLHATRHPVPEGFVRRRWDWERVFGESAALWGAGRSVYSAEQMALFCRVAERARRAMQTLGRGREVFGPIHADLSPKNFLFHGGEVCAIDFDNCGWGHYLYDAASVFLMLEKQRFGRRRGELWAAFLEGYRRESPHLDDHREHLETFAAMRIAASVNRTLRGLGPRPAESPRVPRSLLRGSVRRLERFTAGG